jgi:propanediol dehydratase large subunit
MAQTPRNLAAAAVTADRGTESGAARRFYRGADDPSRSAAWQKVGLRERLAACIQNLVRKKPVSSDQTNYVEQYIYTSGSDGARSTACIRSLVFVAKHVADDFMQDLAKAA